MYKISSQYIKTKKFDFGGHFLEGMVVGEGDWSDPRNGLKNL